jgi:hypothetical protein
MPRIPRAPAGLSCGTAGRGSAKGPEDHPDKAALYGGAGSGQIEQNNRGLKIKITEGKKAAFFVMNPDPRWIFSKVVIAFFYPLLTKRPKT